MAGKGGERGIRTPGTLTGTYAFQAHTIGHSVTSPYVWALLYPLHTERFSIALTKIEFNFIITLPYTKKNSGKCRMCWYPIGIFLSLPCTKNVFMRVIKVFILSSILLGTLYSCSPLKKLESSETAALAS